MTRDSNRWLLEIGVITWLSLLFVFASRYHTARNKSLVPWRCHRLIVLHVMEVFSGDELLDLGTAFYRATSLMEQCRFPPGTVL